MLLFVRLGVLLCFFTCTGFATENSLNAKQMLQVMRQAMDSLNYQGTVALYKNGKLDTMKLYHSVQNGVEYERLLSLNSPIREIIMDQHEIRCDFPDAHETVVMLWPGRQSFFPDLPNDLNDLDDYYVFSNAGSDKIAKKPAYIIDIKPKDRFRYARRIWISQASMLPLKFVLLDKSGMAMEQVMFTDLQIVDSMPVAAQQSSKDPGSKRHVHHLKAEPYDQAGFVLNKIPQGFGKIFLTRRTMHGKDKLIDHLFLSDGFSSISVYLEEFEEDMLAERRAVGAVNSYSRRLDNYLITVMGEVPKYSVKYIAEGAQLRGKQ